MRSRLIERLKTYFLGIIDVYGMSSGFDFDGLEITESDILAELTSRNDD